MPEAKQFFVIRNITRGAFYGEDGETWTENLSSAWVSDRTAAHERRAALGPSTTDQLVVSMITEWQTPTERMAILFNPDNGYYVRHVIAGDKTTTTWSRLVGDATLMEFQDAHALSAVLGIPRLEVRSHGDEMNKLMRAGSVNSADTTPPLKPKMRYAIKTASSAEGLAECVNKVLDAGGSLIGDPLAWVDHGTRWAQAVMEPITDTGAAK